MIIKLVGGPRDGDVAEVDTDNDFNPPSIHKVAGDLPELKRYSDHNAYAPLAESRIDIYIYVLKVFYRAGRAPEYEYHYQE